MTLSLPIQLPNFLPRFYRLASIAVLSNMMIPLAGLFDAAFLGHLADVHNLAGVILGGILFDYLYRTLKFLRNSTNTLTANAMGQDDPVAILASIFRCGLIALCIAGVILLLQYPIHKLGFTVLAGSPNVETAGLEYFNARIWGAPAVLLNFVFTGWFFGRQMNGIIFLMSLVGNGSNVLLDYLMIFKWGWESMGAGLATAISQYLTLLVALIAMVWSTQWQYTFRSWSQAIDRQNLLSAVVLNGNMLVRFLALISAFAIFTNLSASFGTELLAENGLLLQIAFLSQFTVQGIGMTSQTLIGNFRGQGRIDQMLSVLQIALISSLPIALAFALGTVLFPDTIFRLLTSHAEVSQGIQQYTGWLVPFLSLTAAVFMLESYFIGLKDGKTIRNGAALGFMAGFLPLVILGIYQQSEDCLWGALTMYMGVYLVFLIYRLMRTHPLLLKEETNG